MIGLEAGEDLVEIVEGLDTRVQLIHGKAPGGGDDEAGAGTASFVAGDLQAVGDDEHGGPGTGARIDAESADAAGDDEAQVAVGLARNEGRLSGGGIQIVAGVRQVEMQGAGGALQAAQVGFQAKGHAVVETDAFEDAIPVEQAVVEDGHAGLVGVDHLSVKPASFHVKTSLRRA